ncbi:unnamed protein product [Phaedon cochleariae]|uniref:Uncharacterized protein n=1 Tax=Phaedon cochleariae TaxID=80249 RepID=A0A9N9SGY2_PHACE|nr:unnamed protein product [Phaedon cochleariae]
MSQDSLEQADSEHTDVDSNDISFHTEGSLIFAEEKNPLDDLTDQQLIDHINEMETENKHLELENSLFLGTLTCFALKTLLAKSLTGNILLGFTLLTTRSQMCQTNIKREE